MERRSFILGLLAVAAGSGLIAQSGQAQASPQPPQPAAPAGEITLPDGTPIDWAQRHRRPHAHYRRWPRHQYRHRRRNRRVCRTFRDRFGRIRRRCHWSRW